jgi:uncharacterized protein YvpB
MVSRPNACLTASLLQPHPLLTPGDTIFTGMSPWSLQLSLIFVGALLGPSPRLPLPPFGQPPPPVVELPPAFLPSSSLPLEFDPPASAQVPGFTGHPQILSLSCESRSAVDWAAFFGVHIGELAFFKALPVSSDPDIGFVGDVRGVWGQVPPNAYGVHAGPLARLLQQYGLPAGYHLYTPWRTVQQEIASGRPVIVWVTGHVVPGQGQLYLAPDGHRTVVARFEHTVMLIGYTSDSVTIEDEGDVYTRSLKVFMESWQPLRNMAITAQP